MLAHALTTTSDACAQVGLRALPSVWLTPRLVAPEDALSLAASAGYGLFGRVAGTGGAHHRAQGALAFAATSRTGLSFELRLDGRWDVHDVPGGDDSLVGDPRLLARYARRIGRLYWGGELVVFAPGASAPSWKLRATSVDALLIASLPLPKRFELHVALGGRFDNSAASVDRDVLLSRSDRISLGLSSDSALLLRVATSWSIASYQLGAELTADPALGARAPSVLSSPIRAAVTVRHEVLDDLELVGSLQTLLSQRPAMLESRERPFEPRLSAHVGLSYSLGRKAAREPRIAAAPASDPAPIEPQPPAPTPREEPAGELLVTVLDGQKEPLPDAQLVLMRVEESSAGARNSAVGELRSAGSGNARFEKLQPGKYELTVSAAGLLPQLMALELVADEQRTLQVVLEPGHDESVLRVQVRDATTGQPVRAKLQIVSATARARTQERVETDEQGSFERALPQGDYKISLRAAGYVAQTRAVQVHTGVTLFNVDLTPERP